MRWNCTISLSLLTSLLLLSACENPSAPSATAPNGTVADDSQPPGAHIRGIEWIERRPSDVIAYVGSYLTLTLAGGSAVLIETHYTDLIECRIVDAETLCTGGWQDHFVGSYAMDDSLLTLSLAFAGTTANNVTRNNHVASSISVSKYTWNAGEPLKLTLTGVGDGDVFPGRKSLEFYAKARADVE